MFVCVREIEIIVENHTGKVGEREECEKIIETSRKVMNRRDYKIAWEKLDLNPKCSSTDLLLMWK